MSSAKYQPFCFNLNVLTIEQQIVNPLKIISKRMGLQRKHIWWAVLSNVPIFLTNLFVRAQDNIAQSVFYL